MQERILIDFAKKSFLHQEVNTIKEGCLDDFIAEVVAAEKIESPVLPPNCFQYLKDKNYQFFSFLKPAGFETVSVTAYWGGGNYDFTRIPVPFPPRCYLVPFFGADPVMQYIRYAFTDEEDPRELSRMIGNDALIAPWMPNTYSQVGSLCLGTGANTLSNTMQDSDIYTKCLQVLAYIDNSTFNDHVQDFRAWFPWEIFTDPENTGWRDVEGSWGADSPFIESALAQIPNMGNAALGLAHASAVFGLHKIGKFWTDKGGEELALENITKAVSISRGFGRCSSLASMIERVRNELC